MKNISRKSTVLLLIASVIWGFAFVAQSTGMAYMGPLSFNGARFLIGAVVLLPFLLLKKRTRTKTANELHQEPLSRGFSETPPESLSQKSRFPEFFRSVTFRAAVICGIALCIATTLQQVGIIHTTVGKAGFITTLYIIFVPILGIFFRRKAPPLIWIGVALAAAGLYLLCLDETFTVNIGDVLVFLCALALSAQILLIDHYAPKVDGIALAFGQFLTAGVISFIAGIIMERPLLSDFAAGAWPLLYVGVLSTGVAYSLQIAGQKNADPTVASLIFSLEAVFAALGGFLILQQTLSLRELAGCLVMLAAVILVQLPFEKIKKMLKN